MASPLIVLGSANRDLTVVVPRHPLPGETLLGGRLVTGTGGKGANQALAAARTGAAPLFLACVGTDTAGDELLLELAAGGVDVSAVTRATAAPTGLALITVAADGENTIVVVPGANGDLDPGTVVDRIAQVPAPVLLAQLEVPIEAVRAGAVATVESGGRFILNLSPARDVSADLLTLTDPLVVNETEAAQLTGVPVASVEDARTAAATLRAVCRSVVVTLGGDGVVFTAPDDVRHIPAERVPVVDTTGAGDAFVGALAARLAQGASIDEAVHAGVHAGALAVQHVGAQPPRP